MFKIISVVIVIILAIGIVSFTLIFDEPAKSTDTPKAKIVPKSELPQPTDVKIIFFEPTDKSVTCASLSCALLYDDEKCGVGFFVKPNGDYITQGEKYMVSDSEIVKNWDNCQ